MVMDWMASVKRMFLKFDGHLRYSKGRLVVSIVDVSLWYFASSRSCQKKDGV